MMQVTHKIIDTGYHHVRAVGYHHLYAQWPVGLPLASDQVSHGGVEGVEHVCEHQWDGWEEFRDPDGGGGGTAVCSRCGITAMSHSLWTGP